MPRRRGHPSVCGRTFDGARCRKHVITTAASGPITWARSSPSSSCTPRADGRPRRSRWLVSKSATSCGRCSAKSHETSRLVCTWAGTGPRIC